MKRAIALSMLVPLWHSAAWAATLNLGSVSLLPNTPNQQVQFFVQGPGEFVQGLNFNLQVADGGPEGGGSIDGPDISAVDILSGTIFDGNNNGDNGGGSLVPQVWESFTTTAAGTVEADGLLATVTFDTTGFFLGSGPFALIASNTLNGPTDFAGSGTLNVTDGQIAIVPEPAAWLLLAAGIVGLALLRQRTRRRPLPP